MPRSDAPARRELSWAENVDIFPTLVELVGLNPPPVCKNIAESTFSSLCVEGRSLAALVNIAPHSSLSNQQTERRRKATKKAAFWQWTKQVRNIHWPQPRGFESCGANYVADD